MTVTKQLEEIKTLLHHKDKMKPAVSKASVGWQIDHLLRTLFAITTMLEKSNPTDYTSKFNFSWLYIKLRGTIPRGVGKAPKEVKSLKNDFTEEELVTLLEKVNQKVATIKDLDKNAFFKHPYFGNLNKKAAIKFMFLHTKHHVDIIKDIIQ